MRHQVVALALVGLGALLLVPVNLRGQSAAFEVVSVKPNNSGPTAAASMMYPPGAFHTTNLPLRRIIAYAYGFGVSLEQRSDMSGYKIAGETSILDVRFDVSARLAQGAAVSDYPAMVRTLLADRFKLRLHTEMRQVPIYALIVAREGRLGPQLEPSPHDCVAFMKSGGTRLDTNAPSHPTYGSLCWGQMRGDPAAMTRVYAGPISQLVGQLQGPLDRPIIDETGLTGSFAWQLTMSLMRLPAATADTPSIFTAVEEQLGLKLVARQGPLEVFVIDAVEMPTPD